MLLTWPLVNMNQGFQWVDATTLHSLVLSQVCQYLLEAVFSNPRPSVTHFKLTCSDHVFSLRALGYVADIMALKSLHCGQFATEVLTQYNRLLLLAVSIENEDEDDLLTLCKQNVDLRLIIENQTNLHTLHLRTECMAASQASVATPEYDQLIDCLGSLFYRPTFHRLGLYEFELVHSSGQHMRRFNEIMLNFLCSPVRGQELELYFLPCDLMLSDLHVHHCKQPSDSVRSSKSLLIRQDAPPDPNDIPWFFTFFSSPSYPLWSLGYLCLAYHLNIPADILAKISALDWTAS